MSALNEKSEPATNVLTITRPSDTHHELKSQVDVLSTIEDVDSTHSLTPSPTRSHNEKNSLEQKSSAFSPFYSPAPTRYSLEAQKSESKQNINIIPSAYDTDVEACLTPQKTQASCSKAGLLKSKSGKDMDCTVWPGQKAMKMKKKAMRRERGRHGVCGCMAGMNKKTKIWIKVLLACLVVGAAVGVGLGVSKAVGGGVWKNKQNSNAPIEGSNSNSG